MSLTSLYSFDMLKHVVPLHILNKVHILTLYVEVGIVSLVYLLHLERILFI